MIKRECLCLHFPLKWVPGKTHCITGALSQAPIFLPAEMPNLDIDMSITCMVLTQDPILDVTLDLIDSDYRQLAHDVKNNTSLSSNHKLLYYNQDFLSVNNQLMLLNSRCSP